MLLKTGEVYEVPEEFYGKIVENYGQEMVQQELNAMEMWLYANPAKRKTKAGMTKFINSWLKRTKATGAPSPFAQPVHNNPSDDSIRGRSLNAALSSIGWLDDPEREMMKQFYLNKFGFYNDGGHEVKTQ